LTSDDYTKKTHFCKELPKKASPEAFNHKPIDKIT